MCAVRWGIVCFGSNLTYSFYKLKKALCLFLLREMELASTELIHLFAFFFRKRLENLTDQVIWSGWDILSQFVLDKPGFWKKKCWDISSRVYCDKAWIFLLRRLDICSCDYDDKNGRFVMKCWDISSLFVSIKPGYFWQELATVPVVFMVIKPGYFF